MVKTLREWRWLRPVAHDRLESAIDNLRIQIGHLSEITGVPVELPRHEGNGKSRKRKHPHDINVSGPVSIPA